jgi:hypothetical protein
VCDPVAHGDDGAASEASHELMRWHVLDVGVFDVKEGRVRHGGILQFLALDGMAGPAAMSSRCRPRFRTEAD